MFGLSGLTDLIEVATLLILMLFNVGTGVGGREVNHLCYAILCFYQTMTQNF